jgi:transposase
MRYELTDFEWAAIRSFPPNKPRGVPRVDDRRVLNGIFWVLRSGAPWRDLTASYGPRTPHNFPRDDKVVDRRPYSIPSSMVLASEFGNF